MYIVSSIAIFAMDHLHSYIKVDSMLAWAHVIFMCFHPLFDFT